MSIGPKNGELGLYKFIKILGSTSSLVKWAKSTNSNCCKYMSNPSSNHKISSFTNLQREGVHGATWLDPNLGASTLKKGLSWLNNNSWTTINQFNSNRTHYKVFWKLVHLHETLKNIIYNG